MDKRRYFCKPRHVQAICVSQIRPTLCHIVSCRHVMDGAIILPIEATTVIPGLIREETQFSQTGRDEGLFSCAYPHVPTFVLFRAYVWGCTVSFMRNE